MRIGFTGTGGSGKTSVIELLEGKISEYFYPSVVRKTMEKMGRSTEDDLDVPVGQRWELQQAIFQAKMDLDRSILGPAIMDRTLADHLSYCILKCSSVMSISQINSYQALVTENLTSYDLLFYFPPPHWNVKADGFRADNAGMMLHMDYVLMGILMKAGVLPRVHFISPNTDPDVRAIDVLSTVINYRKSRSLSA